MVGIVFLLGVSKFDVYGLECSVDLIGVRQSLLEDRIFLSASFGTRAMGYICIVHIELLLAAYPCPVLIRVYHQPTNAQLRNRDQTQVWTFSPI